ncbi:MAG: ATP-binding cassette domain-containing protein, partial [Bacteroidota bacterium]
GDPVALMPIRGNRYEVYDPFTKETFVIDEDNKERVDVVAYTFFKPFPDKKLNLWDIIKFGIFRDQKDFYLLILMGVGATLLGLVTPIMTGILFDSVIPNADRFQIFQVGFALMMALIGYILFELTEAFALLRIETKMDYRLQAAVWDRLLNLPVVFFRQFTTGDLAERAMGINEIRHMLSGVVITSVLGSIFSLLNFFLLFYYSLELAFVALGLVVVEVLIIYLLGRWQVGKERISREFEGITQGIVLQLLTGIAKLRVTGTEIQAFSHWLNHFSKMKQYSYQAHAIENIQNWINSITPLVFSAVIYSMLILTGEFQSMSTGQFLAFNAAYGAFTAAMLSMSAALVTIYQVFPIYDRTRPILENLPESDDGKANPGKLKGKVEVSQLNFRYDEDSPLVLQDISFKLESGDYVAFVGPSGSGKSTMVRLLLGFEKPESGTIFYDEQELSQLDIRLVRRQIGTVLQDGQLTPGDILSNIIGTSPHLSIDDAWDAAKLAALDDDIRRMPMG